MLDDDERVAVRLRHMAEAIVAIERVTQGKTPEAYSGDPDTMAAVEQYIDRLSETSRHLPESLKERYAAVNWRGVADMGNVLCHTYDAVLKTMIWEVVVSDLPKLKAAVENMRKTSKKRE